MQRDQDSKTKRSTVVPHQSGAGLEAITFRSAKVSDTDLAIRKSQRLCCLVSRYLVAQRSAR